MEPIRLTRCADETDGHAIGRRAGNERCHCLHHVLTDKKVEDKATMGGPVSADSIAKKAFWITAIGAILYIGAVFGFVL